MPLLTLTFPPTAESLPSLRDAVEQWSQSQALPRSTLDVVHLLLEEVVGNVIRYACREPPTPFEVQLDRHDGRLLIEIRDAGPAFDPCSVPPPDLECRLEDRPIGGLGIYLIRCLCDEMIYQRVADRNCLRLVKLLPNPAEE